MTGQFPQVLAGRYELRELIGRGGMAEVRLGYDTRLSRIIALKLLRSDIAGDPTFQARFRREAQSAAALNHPSIVAVYDSGEEELTGPGGTVSAVPYIVMEYVEGHTVRELLGEGEAVPIPEAVEIATGVLDALEYSHRAGIVHRDIKPGNIMLSSTGAVKVMDFGIARAIEDSAGTVTQTHAVVGTAQYLSPEQARGELVDARTDLYSTGCLLYELLTGQPPFTGDSAVAIAYQHVREIPRPPSAVAADVPEGLDRVVLKALAKNRDDRYQDAAHMRADLMAAAHGSAVSAPAADSWNDPTSVIDGGQAGAPVQGPAPAPPATRPEPEGEEDRPRRWWLWLLVLALLIAIGTAIGLTASGFFSSPDPGPTATQTAVAVPDVVQMSPQEAEAAITAAGLVYVQGEDVSSDTVAAGQAVSSEPAAGTSAVMGAQVTVHFSSGSAMVDVPNVAGMPQEQARQTLEAAGLKVGNTTTEDSPSVSKDEVVRTDPVSGTSVQRGSTISLVLSTGRTTVPDLTGMTQEQARQALTEAGLTIGDVTRGESGADKQDLVLSSSPGSGAQLALGSEVSIVLGDGEAVPTPTPTPTSLPALPDVTGKTEAEARAALEQAGFTSVSFGEARTDDPAKVGRVVAMSPAAGTRHDPSRTVMVSLGVLGGDGEPNPGNGNNVGGRIGED